MHLFLSFCIIFPSLLPSLWFCFSLGFLANFLLRNYNIVSSEPGERGFVYISAAAGLAWEVRSPLRLGVWGWLQPAQLEMQRKVGAVQTFFEGGVMA